MFTKFLELCFIVAVMTVVAMLAAPVYASDINAPDVSVNNEVVNILIGASNPKKAVASSKGTLFGFDIGGSYHAGSDHESVSIQTPGKGASFGVKGGKPFVDFQTIRIGE